MYFFKCFKLIEVNHFHIVNLCKRFFFPISALIAKIIVFTSVSPSAIIFLPISSERERHSAALRSSAFRYVFLELFAKPSFSRIIGQPTISISKFKSLTIFFITHNCCASLLTEIRSVRLNDIEQLTYNSTPEK